LQCPKRNTLSSPNSLHPCTRKEKENIVEIELSGSHNDFPSYQGKVNEEDFYFHEAIGDGPGFGNLRGTGSPFKPAKTSVGL